MLRLVVISLLAVASPAFAGSGKSACPEGQAKVKGKCVALCASEGKFAAPDACECPAGYGKILHGDGTGECAQKACPTNAPFKETMACACPARTTKEKYTKKKNMAVCRPESATTAKAP
jgi:hypothetical protein